MTTNRPLRVFLCHSSADKPAVRELYQKLRAEPWIQPWLDEEELYPGQDWDLEIEKSVESSDVVIVCLSNNSIHKKGYVQKELRFALDIALEMPEETIFIIPLRLEECTPPRSLRDWQYADYFEGQHERAFERLVVSLKRRSDSLNLGFEDIEPSKISKPSSRSNEKIEKLTSTLLNLQAKAAVTQNKITLSTGMEFMRIPAGKFLMGINNHGNDEKPQHTVDIPYDYWMARFPVTSAQYSLFKLADFPKGKENHPVVGVTWRGAMEYCQWLNQLLKKELPSNFVLRLSTEAEWEKAARGTDGREYPWGNQFDKNKCNTDEGGKSGTTSVGMYSPHGDSPYGCADMSGNVWEWVHSLFKPYPYVASDGREDEKEIGTRVLRGGAHTNNYRKALCTFRKVYSIVGFSNVGFRAVISQPIQFLQIDLAETVRKRLPTGG